MYNSCFDRLTTYLQLYGERNLRVNVANRGRGRGRGRGIGKSGASSAKGSTCTCMFVAPCVGVSKAPTVL